MSTSSRPLLWTVSLLLAGGVAGAFIFLMDKPPVPVAVATQPATVPQTMASATEPATQPQPIVIRTYGQLLHADLPNYPETRPWAWSVDLTDAAHIIIHEPLYVCPHGEMWIVRPDADPLPAVLARAAGDNEHIVPQPVRYILWTLSRKGEWAASAVVGDGENFELVSATDRRPIPWHRSYHWERATNWDDNGVTRLIVPTDTGVSIITVDKSLSESYCPLLASATTQSDGATTVAFAASQPVVQTAGTKIPAPLFLFDTRGLLAWIPADGDFHGGKVARFVDGKWIDLDPASWPGNMIHLVPLLDGSVLQIRREGDPQSVTLSIVQLDNSAIDKGKVMALVEQLADDDPDKRVQAYAELARYGQGIYPLLEKIEPDAVPEAKGRIRALLDGGLVARLGGMLINDNLLTVAARLKDGGVIFFAPHGVSIPQDGHDPKIVNPDYLVVRPSRAVHELPGALMEKLDASKTITALRDEWILTSPEQGPQRYLPPAQFYPLLHPAEHEFSRLLAIDTRGRWLLRGAAASGAAASTQPTLVIDPTVPDPTPRLAIWMIDSGKDIGWDKSDYATLLSGATHWLVTDRDWEVMSETDDKMTTELPPTTSPSPSLVALASTSLPSSIPSTAPQPSPLLLVDAQGNRYYDGQLTLTVVEKNGNRIVWTLPPQCAGSDDERAWLAPDREGHLFLFNGPARIIRLRPTPHEAQPFAVEAVFQKNIPPFREIRRVWLDPAGRIAVAYEQWRLAIIFPSGQIAPEIANRVLPRDVKRTDEP